jgi:hypothetical protein
MQLAKDVRVIQKTSGLAAREAVCESMRRRGL